MRILRRRSTVFNRLHWLLAVSVLGIAIWCLTPVASAQESTSSPDAPDANPVIRIARTKFEDNQWCVSHLAVHDLDQFTRISLASEITHVWESPLGMRAMSLVIRGIGRYHVDNPWNLKPFCEYVQPFTYHLDDKRVAFVPFKSSKTHGNEGSKSNDQVTETMGSYLRRPSALAVYFNDCIHQKMNDLAISSPWLSPTQIATNVFANPGTCASLPPCSNEDPNGCYYSDLMSIPYSLMYGLTSMTNATAAMTPPNTSQNISAVGFNQVRQAEQFWGNDMGHGLVGPHNQPGTYIVSQAHALLAEYVVSYSYGASATLFINGISDRPGPVIANIYVDGYYKGQVQWVHNDNQRHLVSFSLPYLPQGYHLIAIQQYEATWGTGQDTTRWLYLDDLGVAPH